MSALSSVSMSPVATAVRIAFIAAALPCSAMAADMLDDESKKIEHIEVKGEVQSYKVEAISTATKTNTPLRDIPQAITVLTEEQIDDQAMQNMADVVRYVPGVQMAQGEGHRDAPIFRGNTSTADFYINGMRDDVQYLRDLYNVQRVEVLKGPSGMIFGRGSAGGLINRVTKQANWSDTGSIDASIGSWQQARINGDYNYAVNDELAVRLTGMYEDSEGYRDFYTLERSALNPTLTYKLAERTTLALSYEHFDDERITDRGIPFDPATNKPLHINRATFIGNPDLSDSTATVDAVSATISHEFLSGALLVNQTRYADYDKFYGNVFPGAYTPANGRVAVSAYSSSTARQNLMNQTDLTFEAKAGTVTHKMLVGAELNQQDTDNQRLTGYFTDVGANATAAFVTLANPVYRGNIQFRASATDADNTSDATAKAVYVQDQIEITPQWQAVLGLRYDDYQVELENHRNGSVLKSEDDLLSPRAGLIYKPVEDVSVYLNYSKAYVPRAGEQMASLTISNAALDPESFINHEFGVKWDISGSLSVATALYQLDRTNVAVTDPADPTRSILVDGQQVNGVEFEVNGKLSAHWDFVAGYAFQDSEILAPAAQKGKHLSQVPEHSFSLWNRYQINDQWGAGLGLVSQSSAFVAVDNLVTLPGLTRVDAAVFYTPMPELRLQLNLENLTDKTYYASAHSNNNITPASPRAARLGVSYKF